MCLIGFAVDLRAVCEKGCIALLPMQVMQPLLWNGLFLAFFMSESETDAHCEVDFCMVQRYSFFRVAERDIVATDIEIESFRVEIQQ